jgi:7-carboxy-7-deazaguanine synthase
MIHTLRLNEIFVSIQGESSFAGWPCVFIRTTGCPLRCAWCDTKYAYNAGEEVPLDAIVEQVLSLGVQHVEATGGEPLAQLAMPQLLTALCDQGKTLLLETSGAMDISVVDPRVHIIMDIKCPGSGMTSRMLWKNIDHLRSKDEVKFVLNSREDYTFARDTIREHQLPERCTVLLSTTSGSIHNRDVVHWMLEDKLQVRFQLQLHKTIWDPQKKGV